MVKIEINAVEFYVKNNISVLEACKIVGFYLPRFCYHETLSVAGNCRMCLIEINGMPKPMTACALPILANMKIWINSPMVRKARENIIEALLLQHPLDCPICDQGGECDLQDQSRNYGSDRSRNFFNKRGCEDKNFSDFILGIMTRCIHCTRCVRFNAEITGSAFLGTLNRGGLTEIGSYNSQLNKETYLIGNVIDLCPVGALTSKTYSFKARPWELKSVEAIDLTDGLGCNIYIGFKETEIVRILPKINVTLNGSFISDKTRFFFDALTTYRVFSGYIKQNNKFISVPKMHALQELATFIDCLLYTTVIISAENDFELYLLLQHLTYKYAEILRVKTFSSKINRSNIKLGTPLNFNEALSTANLIVLVSTSLYIENAILNSKLRNKSLLQNISIYGISSGLNVSLGTNFINFVFTTFFFILKGKSSLLKGYSLLKSHTFFLIGETFFQRGIEFNQLNSLIKSFLPHSNVLTIRLLSNSYGLEKTPLVNAVRKDFNRKSFFVLVHLLDNIRLAKNLYQKKIFYSVLNPFGSKLARFSSILVPTSTAFEGGLNTFFNLEGRNQSFEIKSLPFALKISARFAFEFCFDYTINPLEIALYNFKNTNINLIFFKPTFLPFININILTKQLVNMYPIKKSLTDFFLTSIFTQTSQILAKVSQTDRKQFINF